MNRHPNPGRLAIIATVLALVATGCQQGGSGSNLYASSAAATQQVASAPDTKAKIVSSCPKLIDIPGGEQHTCTFSEAGYSGKFHITEDPNYYYTFTISPTVGNKNTAFVIQAMDSGGGHFSITDSKGNRMIRDVRVSS